MIYKLLLWSAITFAGLIHDYHVAVTEISYNSKTRSLEFTHKLFFDDLEKAIEQKYGVRLYLGNNVKQSPQSKEIINKYLSETFSIKVNDKPVKPVLIGFEQENDQVFAFAEIQDINKIKSIEVNNKVMLELFADQANLVHFNVNGLKKSLYFNKSATSGKESFK